MSFFKNRAVAIIIAGLVIVGSTGASAISGLNKLYEKQVEDVFADELEGKMDNCASAATGVATTLVAYPEYQEQMTALRSARNGYLESRSVEEKIIYYVKLKENMDGIKDLVYAGAFSEQDEKMLSAYFSSYDTAVLDVIRSTGTYNKSAEAFIDTITSFPTNFFAEFTDLGIPEIL